MVNKSIRQTLVALNEKRCRLYDHAPWMKYIVLVLIAGLAGCAAGPDYRRPDPPVPANWSAQELPAHLDTGHELENWWNAFDDPALNELIQRANGRNIRLQEAIARFEESNALLRTATGKNFPVLDATGTVSSDNGQQSENASRIALPGIFSTQTTYGIGMASSWEIDLFGHIRRSTEAASAHYEASIEDFRAVLVSLYAEIATAYIDYRAFHHRLILAEEHSEYEKKLRDLVAARVKAGTASQVELAEAEAGWVTARTQVPPLRNAMVLSANRLTALLALTPGTLNDLLQREHSIPEPPETIAVILPIDVVRQRPDIRKSERRLAAQTAMIGVRAADLYPRFSLTGSFSFSSFSAETLLKSASLGFNFGPTLTWNIFQGGTIQAQVKAEEARTRQSLAIYENTLIMAFEEVENAISSYAKSRERLESLNRLVDERKRAAGLAGTLFSAGKMDYQAVLEKLIVLNAAENLRASEKATLSQSFAALYRTLGGGWAKDSLNRVMATIRIEKEVLTQK